MDTAFIVKENFQIVRLAEGDVRCKSDHLANFENLILANQQMYPEIERWYSNKVLPGIRQEERVAFIGYLNEKPAVSAVVKKGSDAKFCHLRIHEALRDTNLGEVFFSMMALEIRDLAKNIHFTLPESLWQEKGKFFQSFGFSSAELAEAQYRLFDREMACSAAFPAVWDSVLQKIPKLADLYAFGGFAADNQLLMSVKPEFAERIMCRKKTVELRRKFSTRWIGHRINIYASAPVMGLMGEARIAGVVVNNPEMIWERFHDQIGCSRPEFDAYIAGASEVYAIELDEVRPYRERFPLGQISHLIKEHLTPPQSYMTLEKNRPWAKAVSLAAYLHGCFKSTMSFALEVGSPTCKKPTPNVTRLSQPELI
jgi:predicted transcriptional regulator